MKSIDDGKIDRFGYSVRVFLFITFLVVLVISIVRIDYYFIVGSILALVLLLKIPREENSPSYKGVAMILYVEIRKSDNPRFQLREKIQKMIEEDRFSDEAIVEILEYLRDQQDEIGDEAAILLASIGKGLS